VAFLTNPAGLSDAPLKDLAELATEDARAQLELIADDLIATLREQRGKGWPQRRADRLAQAPGIR
jgi:hypothetical protein